MAAESEATTHVLLIEIFFLSFSLGLQSMECHHQYLEWSAHVNQPTLETSPQTCLESVQSAVHTGGVFPMLSGVFLCFETGSHVDPAELQLTM